MLKTVNLCRHVSRIGDQRRRKRFALCWDIRKLSLLICWHKTWILHNDRNVRNHDRYYIFMHCELYKSSIVYSHDHYFKRDELTFMYIINFKLLTLHLDNALLFFIVCVLSASCLSAYLFAPICLSVFPEFQEDLSWSITQQKSCRKVLKIITKVLLCWSNFKDVSRIGRIIPWSNLLASNMVNYRETSIRKSLN